MRNISRRNLLKMSGISFGGAAFGLSTFPLKANGGEGPEKKLKIIVIGAHPDDPETGCGGTMLSFAKNGHEVVSAYLTRGEAGISGTSHEAAARIRTKEAQEACKIMQVRLAFLGQTDGSCEITHKRYEEMYDFLKAENPDIVFTHWPVDTHRDHRICSILVYDAWLRLNRTFGFYYFEVESGTQTQNFAPTHFIDIGRVIGEKHKACLCHVSQHIDRVIQNYHGPMEKFRGMQAGCEYAEAFVKHDQSSNCIPS